MDEAIRGRRCTRCQEHKALEEFSPNRRMRLGVGSHCKACARELARLRRATPEGAEDNRRRAREWRVANPEKAREVRRRYYESHREEIAEKDRVRRIEKADELRSYHQRYNTENLSKRLAKNRRWIEANPEKKRAQRLRRRARMAGVEPGLDVDVEALWTGTCALCSEPIDATLKRPDWMSKSIDHIVPLSKGGSHAQDNLQWTHLICNIRKGARIDE